MPFPLKKIESCALKEKTIISFKQNKKPELCFH